MPFGRFSARCCRAGALVVLVATAAAIPASAADPHAARAGADAPRPEADTGRVDLIGDGSRRHVRISRVAAPPRLDGRLDDGIWSSAARVTGFVQRNPSEGAPATEHTDVRLAFDTERIYAAIYAHYSDTRLIRANRLDRDQTGADDRVLLFFDPFLDQQRGYVFSVNGYGVQGDALMAPGGGGGGPGGPGDASWDALFYSAAQLVDDGWTAELAIPFKSLRYPAPRGGEMHRWGFQAQREIKSKNETDVWSPVSRDVMGFLSQMGTLDGLADLSTSRNLELLPTFTAVQASGINDASGRYERLSGRPEAGVSVKYGLTPNLVVDATANPDFSQIESDQPQIEVNQRFPIFYPERRPFFLEGQEIFAVQGPVTLLHTRTIIDPQFGAKLTGKTGRLALGFLVANDAAAGRLDDPGDPRFGDAASVVVGRARYDLYSESSIGVIASSRTFHDVFSRVGGVDAQLRLGRNHRLGFRAIASDRRGEDGVRRSGPLLDIGLRRESRHLRYGLSHFEIHPDFGTDLGFVRRVDTKETNANVEYRWWPEGTLQTWGPRVSYMRNYDYANVLQDEQTNAELSFEFAHNVSVDGGVRKSMERYLGVPFDKTRLSLGVRVNTSRRVSFGTFFNAGDEIRYVDDPFLGRGREFSLFVNLRPLSRLQGRVDLDTSRLADTRSGAPIYTVTILRTQTTFHFTDRWFLRNINDYNAYDETFGANVLLTYRVNAGTAVFAGYDDRAQQGDRIAGGFYPTSSYRRTGRALFVKLQYLFRY